MALNEYANIESDGSIRVPQDIARGMGFTPGARAKIRRFGDQVILQRPIAEAARVYVEPTTACNLRCRTCIRNVWDEPIGHMAAETFARVVAGVRALPVPPTVVFGGLGEPLVHSGILDMVLDLSNALIASWLRETAARGVQA